MACTQDKEGGMSHVLGVLGGRRDARRREGAYLVCAVGTSQCQIPAPGRGLSSLVEGRGPCGVGCGCRDDLTDPSWSRTPPPRPRELPKEAARPHQP